MINLKEKGSQVREARLGSSTSFEGTLRNLPLASGCGTEGRKRCFSQSSLCNAACALSTLSYITDAAIVHHAPSGCAVTAMQTCNSKDQLAAKLKLDNSKSCYVCTDMNESDTVFGATENLANVVREVRHRYGSNAIFIGSSCVSGVIGEDLESVARELTLELEIPVAAVHCEGFRTKIWASGFDAAYHAILQSVVKPPQKKTNIINVINFFGSAREELTAIFARLGVEPLFLISNTTVEQLSHLSESKATLSTCGTLGTYLGNGLQQTYGVPYIRSLQPHGIAGFEDWLSQLGTVLGKSSTVKVILEEERDKYLPQIEQLKKKLKKVRALVAMGPGFNFNTIRALQELGIEVIQSVAWHLDTQYDDGKAPPALEYLKNNSTNDFDVSVNDLQNHQLISLLREKKPDVFFSRHVGSTVWAMKLGIPALCLYDEYAILGYRGLLNFAQSVLDVITNRSFTDNLKRRVKIPYTDWWLSQPANYFANGGV